MHWLFQADKPHVQELPCTFQWRGQPREGSSVPISAVPCRRSSVSHNFKTHSYQLWLLFEVFLPPAGEWWRNKPEKSSLPNRGSDPTEGGNDQKLSWPASHNSCQERGADEFNARKHVVKIAPVVRPTPIKISAVSA